MGWFQKIMKGFGYILNPAGILIDKINEAHQSSTEPGNPNYVPPHETSSESPAWWNQFKNWVSGVWDDVTGKSQIELQNQLNRELAEEEYQRNLQSIGDTAAAYEAAGFNRNLMYNQSPAQYNAPNLTAYSGTQKIDKILQRTGQVLSMIPAMYQATAALEAIDQAREKTKQSEIKTMSMGMSLLDQGYKLGDVRLTHPFTPTLYPHRFGDKRHVKELDYTTLGLSPNSSEFSRYADAALKNKFDLLASIGIKNQMNSTLNNWRGYQYSLDRRFGAAGRIVGMGAQGLGAVGKLFTPIKLFGK